MQGQDPQLSGSAEMMYRGFAAPYKGLPDAGYNGFRRFPLSIPLTIITTATALPKPCITKPFCSGAKAAISYGVVQMMYS